MRIYASTRAVSKVKKGLDLEKAIEIENLSFSYPDGQKALRDVSLTVGIGESVAIVGPNGAGKSTLLLHLNGILKGEGMVRILGLPVNDRHLKEIRRRVGLVFQSPEDQLFSPTVFDDVAFGPINMGLPEDEVRRRVKWALKQVGMSGHEGRSPHHLSVGEKKRVAIATVLAIGPEILAIDEPTGDLDPRGRWELIELLRNLPMTKLIASHDLEAVRALCQRTIILDKGRVVADGFTHRILSDVPLLASHGLAPPN